MQALGRAERILRRKLHARSQVIVTYLKIIARNTESWHITSVIQPGSRAEWRKDTPARGRSPRDGVSFRHSAWDLVESTSVPWLSVSCVYVTLFETNECWWAYDQNSLVTSHASQGLKQGWVSSRKKPISSGTAEKTGINWVSSSFFHFFRTKLDETGKNPVTKLYMGKKQKRYLVLF